ncbi:MAG: hypothetical protein PHC28_13490 [Flavobacterium sp.]|uniref:hypothetical protein n=1 Tax=Flavobacterium sp. TaxID=239 RepID=UPI0026120DA2|nr:hypothetical protein [Flavobacterium sp.]MDD5151466.1 hypothetical protein [Flavobacterium sp.]
MLDNKIFITELFRISDDSSKYIVGVFDNIDDAFKAGKIAKHYRGGMIWDFIVHEFKLNKFNQKHLIQYKKDYELETN